MEMWQAEVSVPLEGAVVGHGVASACFCIGEKGGGLYQSEVPHAGLWGVWSVKVMVPTLLPLGPAQQDSTTLLCSLPKMGLIVEAPTHKAMVKKKEKHNRSLCRAWHQRRGLVGTNNTERGWTPILSSAAPDCREASGMAGTLYPGPVPRGELGGPGV